MTVTVLIENEGRAGLAAEHGLSLYIRHGDSELLLDAGQSGEFLQNAAALGCPVERVSAAVLSHGHFDHADGFPALFRVNGAVKVHARPAAMAPRYNPHSGKYNGVTPSLREEHAGRFLLSDEVREIAPGLWLVPDQVDHEQSLVAETGDGLVVMNSCCHAGADNVVAGVLAQFPGKRVRALAGGFHLMGHGGVATLGPEPDAVRALARRLTEELGVEALYTGHCTGAPALALLQEAASDRVHTIHTGEVLEF